MDARAVAVVAALCLSISSTAGAQLAVGTLRDSASSGVIGGAVVIALDSARQLVSRTITSDRGRYGLEIPSRATQLRIVRLGFEPRVVTLPRQRAPVTTIDVAMIPVATLLGTTLVNDGQLCSTDVDRHGALSLWEQARAGLLATVVARESLRANATVMRYQRLIDDASTRVVQHTDDIENGRTGRPFLAGDPPELLAAFGYIGIDSAGNRVFRAPDADVLLDDTFAATHCFNLQPADATHQGLTGLAFEPTKAREKLVDVAGTLWLDASAQSMSSIEYHYTDPDKAFAKVGAGGVMRFLAMPNGVSLIKDWVIRLPVLDTTARGSALEEDRVGLLGQRRVPRQTSEAGGRVLYAIWPDTSSFSAPLKPFRGTVLQQKTTTPMRDMRVVFEAFRDTLVSDSTGHVEMTRILPGKYTAAAVDTTFATFIEPRISRAEFVVLPDADVDVRFELPGLNDLVKAICEGSDMPRQSTTLIGRIGNGNRPVPLPRNVSIVASWNSASGFKGGSKSVMVDGAGHFAVCGVPAAGKVTLTSSRFGYDFADLIVSMRDAVLQPLDWELDASAMTRLAGQKLATVKGIVTSELGRAIMGAEVWLPTSDRRVMTDSLGYFVLDSLPSGPTLLQVRKLGFSAQRDKLLLGSGEVRSRAYVLGPEITELEGMSVVASSLRGKSSGYRGFEARRTVAISGKFLSDSALRKLDDRPLSSILLSRITGATSVPGLMGQTHLVSTSRMCEGSANSCRMPNCYVTLYVDGHLVYPLSVNTTSGAAAPRGPVSVLNVSGAEQPPDINFFQVSALSGVEFYPNSQPTPPEFTRPGSKCGTLLLWSRER